MKKYLKFILVSYITALIFETIANTIGDGQLFKSPNAIIFFIIWYGLIYSIAYLFFKNTNKLWKPVVYFAIFGTIAEIFVFHRSNLIVDPIIYAIMATIPFSTILKRGTVV